MIKINIVDTLLMYISEYVKIEIYDNDSQQLLTSYDGRNSIDETYLDAKVMDFGIDNGLVTIWVDINSDRMEIKK